MWPFNRRNEARSFENPSVSLSDVGAIALLMGGAASEAGVQVTPDKALTVPAYACGVNFWSKTVAALPLHLYRKTATGSEKAENDPLYAIVHDVVNDDNLTSFAWRDWMMATTFLTGRAMTFIERNGAGRVMNLWPLETAKATVHRVNGRREYTYKDGNVTHRYAGTDVIDIVWRIMPDGLTHADPIAKLKNALGLSLALEAYASKFFQNGGVPPLSLEGPITTPAGAKRASEDVSNALQVAREEKRNVLVLPTGHSLKPIGVNPNDSQMEAARRFQVEEIARGLDLPPTFLHDLTRATFSNSEHADLHLVKHPLGQWMSLIEAELNAKLFGPRNRKKYVRFNADGLLRGDFKTRMEGLSKGIQNSLMTPDEGRGLLELPTMGGQAGKLHIQGATVPLGSQPLKPVAPATEQENANVDA